MILSFPIRQEEVKLVKAKFPLYLKSDVSVHRFENEDTPGISVYDHSIGFTNKISSFTIESRHSLATKEEFDSMFNRVNNDLKAKANIYSATI